jgi:hypothetical protein
MVAQQSLSLGWLHPLLRQVLVNGAAGVFVAARGGPISIMGFTVRGGKIIAINALADAARLQKLDLASVSE